MTEFLISLYCYLVRAKGGALSPPILADVWIEAHLVGIIQQKSFSVL